MNLTDLNRHGGIGANSLFLEIGPFKIVLDAGMHPKLAGHDAVPDFRKLEPYSVDLVVLTHCHLDHLGALPVLKRNQPDAPILCTLPSSMIAPKMLHNSVNVMEKQRAELGLTELPLYTHHEVARMRREFTPIQFGRTFVMEKKGERIEIVLHRAGHVAGAAGVEITYKHRRIFCTGDVLFDTQYTLPGASFPDGKFDTLILETTHGLKVPNPQVTRESELERLITMTDQILSHGGSVVIPVFALGRMQEVLTILQRARDRRQLRPCPIYSAGLGLALADIFDEITRKTGLINFRRKVLKRLGVQPLPWEIKPGRRPAEPSLFIVSSGMMMRNTASYAVGASLLGDHRSGVFFVGYCDPDTPGGLLQRTHQGQTFLFEGLDYTTPVAAQVEHFDLTGHASRDELANYALACDPRVTVLNHGDPSARDWFRHTLNQKRPEMQVVDPEPLKAIEV